jgi:hypothetical protein
MMNLIKRLVLAGAVLWMIAAMMVVAMGTTALVAAAQGGCNDYYEPPVYTDFGSQGVWLHYWKWCQDDNGNWYWIWGYWDGPY